MLSLHAPAKINLTLEVLGQRKDGYHEIRSLIQAVNLCDILRFEPAEGIHLICDEPSLASSDNLVLKAAELLQRQSGCSKGARITLQKRIPWAAGLGGGSSDAAATLKGLNDLWGLKLSLSEMAYLAKGIGSDVPFFIYGGLALSEGRGEQITPLPTRLDIWLVLLIPPTPRIEQKTPKLYKNLNANRFTKGNHTVDAMNLISKGSSLASAHLFNVFDDIAPKVFEGLTEYQRLFEESAADKVHLAGSGPALFAMLPEQDSARRIISPLKSKGLGSYLVRPTYKYGFVHEELHQN
jgi:4-diphosphocytidyl-2-C-methyl-D-erythritol kinase